MKHLNLNKPLGHISVLSLLALCSSAIADSSGHQHDAMPLPAISMQAMPMDEAQQTHPGHALAAEEVSVTGVINAILLNTRQLKIHHGPIVAWQMGAMQMKFQLDPSIDIRSLKAGQKIRFRLRQQGIGRFLITELNY